MKWNGDRIRQAREIQGLTQEDLAASLGVSQPHISLIEQNAENPSQSLVESLSLVTGFPTSFFQREMVDFPLGSLLYRKTRTIPSAGAARLRQTARVIVNAIGELGSHFKAIPVAIPRLGSCDPQEAAQQVRSALGVSPDEPIVGLARKLERSGVVVFYLPITVEGFEAFSAWSDEEVRRPVICLAPPESGDRVRRTISHELGHLVLHQDFLGSPSELDDEADSFAGELLYPEEAMRRELQLPLTLTALADLKRRWGLSMAAIAHYAERRGLITPRQKQYLRAKLYRKGWLDREPVEIPIEFPKLLRQMVEGVRGSRSARELARDLAVSPTLFSEILQANRPQVQGQMAVSGPVGDAHPRPPVGGDLLRFPDRRNGASGS